MGKEVGLDPNTHARSRNINSLPEVASPKQTPFVFVYFYMTCCLGERGWDPLLSLLHCSLNPSASLTEEVVRK
jgi:hypothetical protein